MPIEALFITGRFRSGSTLLWNIFRNIPRCCSYYEPCHDLLPTHIRLKSPATPGHVGVSSYWDEYLPIYEGLEVFHRPDFGINHLHLEEDSPYADLDKYIRFLVSSTSDKLPVLQFNRVDFRLPWLRRHFPEAKIIHLFRNPREQWFSIIRDLPNERRKDPYENTNYELMTWSCSLCATFPFLFGSHIKTSYHRHYLLWKLSKLMGERLSDLSIDFDDGMIVRPAESIRKMLALAEINDADVQKLANLVVTPEKGKWRHLESEDWFGSAEKECDALLDQLGLSAKFGLIPLVEICRMNKNAWDPFFGQASRAAIEEALKLFSRSRNEGLDGRNNAKLAIADYRERLDYIAEVCSRTKRSALLKIFYFPLQEKLNRIADACNPTLPIKKPLWKKLLQRYFQR
ncbi:MAG: sulfotransferase [Desulfobacterales bacterium]|nr:sulfotransferase [Desulfobacterales bacterium]